MFLNRVKLILHLCCTELVVIKQHKLSINTIGIDIFEPFISEVASEFFVFQGQAVDRFWFSGRG